MQINVTKSLMPSYEEYCKMIKSIFESRHLTNMGPLHNEFADRVGAYLGVDNVSLFTNDHLALSVAIKALELTAKHTSFLRIAYTHKKFSDLRLKVPVFYMTVSHTSNQ